MFVLKFLVYKPYFNHLYKVGIFYSACKYYLHCKFRTTAMNIKMHLTFREKCQEFFVKNCKFNLSILLCVLCYLISFRVFKNYVYIKKAQFINILSKKSGLYKPGSL